MMVVKTISGFKKLTVLAVALLGFLVVIKWDARADLSNSYRVTVAQNETQTTSGEKDTPAPEGEESEPSTEEKKESAGATEKPLKNFQPSERIEAEQAVDFPYDI
jgi:cytoskeletal protein RodZ